MDEARARDVVMRGMLAAIRDGHDADWCCKRLVKPLKRLLVPPMNVLHIGREMEAARAEASASLSKFCSTCPLEGCRDRGEKGCDL
jgi:hypothetical protein